MPTISLLPAGPETARLTALLPGSEWFEFDAVLSPATHLRFAADDRPFPGAGTVSIRRGMDVEASGERIADSFRYIGSSVDQETGDAVDERFGVTLFMQEAAFDRLLQRMHWGLPALALTFDPASPVVMADPAGGADALRFRQQPQPWERITGVTLSQRPGVRPAPAPAAAR